MSRYCPSCGSSVGADDAECQNCGEQMNDAGTDENVQSAPAAPAEATTPTHAATPVMAGNAEPAPPARREPTRITCTDCGAENPADAAECSVCGSDLAAQAAAPVAPVRKIPAPPSSSTRDYLLATVAAIIIAGIALLVSTPEEKTGPPVAQQPQQQQADPHSSDPHSEMPAGHPPVDEKKMTPEQEQQMAALTERVRTNPADTAAKRELANIYYDLDRHDEALALYRDYLAKDPRNLFVRTDMAFSLATSVNLDSGITELHSVLKQDPRFQNAAYNLAMMHLAKRNRDSTIYWLEKVVELDPNSRPGQFASQVLTDISKGGLEGQGPAHP